MKTQIKSFLDALDCSHRTALAYQNALNQFVAAVGEDAELNLDNYVLFLMAIKSKSPSTKRVYTTAVRKFYTFHRAGNSDELKERTEYFCHTPSKRTVKFNRDAVEKVIAYCESLDHIVVGSSLKDLEALRDRAFVLTLADTGLRISEACALRCGDINWSENLAIAVEGNKRSTIYFSNRSIEAIKSYLRVRDGVTSKSQMPLASQPVFARHDIRSSKRIRPITAGGMWKAIKGDPRIELIGRIEEAGVDRSLVRIHDFRHYFVTMVYLAKHDLKMSQILARHESINSTYRYVHFDNEVAEAYDEIFNKGNA
jgi:integrase/recombinase XerC